MSTWMSTMEDNESNFNATSEPKLGDEFLNAKCLMNCELPLLILQRNQMTSSGDPPNRASSQAAVLEKSVQYMRRFSRYTNPEAVRRVREMLVSRYRLDEFEVCVLGNLVDEAVALVPSLENRGRETVEEMLNELSLIKKFE